MQGSNCFLQGVKGVNKNSGHYFSAINWNLFKIQFAWIVVCAHEMIFICYNMLHMFVFFQTRMEAWSFIMFFFLHSGKNNEDPNPHHQYLAFYYFHPSPENNYTPSVLSPANSAYWRAQSAPCPACSTGHRRAAVSWYINYWNL